MKNEKKTWFITGATPGGFGMAYAEAALERGDQVAVTVRRPELLEDWARDRREQVSVLALDVTDAAQVGKAVAEAEERFGGIDVLVNNAGRGVFGSVEAMDEAAARDQIELNFFAAISVARAVLPGMRARRRGWIIMMSSMAGLRPVKGFGYYSAAKAALEAATVVLRDEVSEYGVRVMAIEPGAFRTGAYAGFADQSVPENNDAYREMLDAIGTSMAAQHERQPGDPRRGVRAVIDAMESRNPPQRLVLGSAAFDAITAELEQTLTDIRADEGVARGADFDAGR